MEEITIGLLRIYLLGSRSVTTHYWNVRTRYVLTCNRSQFVDLTSRGICNHWSGK